MFTHGSAPTPRCYAEAEWKRLARTPSGVMIPVAFDDLLAPNLPVDAMRILRHLWFRTWGRVRPNQWMPPKRIAERLPEWALEYAMTAHAYAVYRDLSNWERDDPLAAARVSHPPREEPPYRAKRRTWAETWEQVEEAAREGRLDNVVEQQRADLEGRQFIPGLMRLTVTQQELAAAFGPYRLGRRKPRGTRTRLRETVRWMEEVGLITCWRNDGWSPATYEFGPETWHVLTTGDFSPAFRERFNVSSPPSKPFFQVRSRGFTPRAQGYDGVKVRFGEHYRVAGAVDALESHLPQSVMPVVWYVLRNTLGRPSGVHSSLGYVAVANKDMARLFGPVNVARPKTRGRRVQTVRAAIDWCVANGVLERRRRGDWTELSIGPELWHVLKKSDFTPWLSKLLGSEGMAIDRNKRAEDDLYRVERLLGNESLPLLDSIRFFRRVRRAS